MCLCSLSVPMRTLGLSVDSNRTIIAARVDAVVRTTYRFRVAQVHTLGCVSGVVEPHLLDDQQLLLDATAFREVIFP